MTTNKDALDTFTTATTAFDRATDTVTISISESEYDEIRNALQTQAELVEALRGAIMQVTPQMTVRAVMYCLDNLNITHKDGTRLSKETYEAFVNTIYSLMEDERVNHTHAKAMESFGRLCDKHKADGLGWD